MFDEKLRERRGPRFALLDKGITECRKFELYNAKLDIYSVLHFIIHYETMDLHIFKGDNDYIGGKLGISIDTFIFHIKAHTQGTQLKIMC